MHTTAFHKTSASATAQYHASCAACPHVFACSTAVTWYLPLCQLRLANQLTLAPGRTV